MEFAPQHRDNLKFTPLALCVSFIVVGATRKCRHVEICLHAIPCGNVCFPVYVESMDSYLFMYR